MEIDSVDAALKKISKYCENDVATPFFVVLEDSTEYSEIIAKLDY